MKWSNLRASSKLKILLLIWLFLILVDWDHFNWPTFTLVMIDSALIGWYIPDWRDDKYREKHR